MIERAAAGHSAGLNSLFVGDQHVSPTPYYQNTLMLGRLLSEWGKAPAGCLFLTHRGRRSSSISAEVPAGLGTAGRIPMKTITPATAGTVCIPRQGRRGADTGRPSRINVSQAGGVAAIRIDIAASSAYLPSCPSGTQSTSGPPLDCSEIRMIPPGLKRMLGASHAIRSGGQPCSPRARRSRRGLARS